MAAAQRVLHNALPAGPGTGTLDSAILTHLPFRVGEGSPLAVLGVMPPRSSGGLRPDQMELLASPCGQAALAPEVDRLEQRRRLAETEAVTERLRSSVLSTVSHDLRTPVASNQGCSESLLESGEALGEQTRREHLRIIWDESQRIGSMI